MGKVWPLQLRVLALAGAGGAGKEGGLGSLVGFFWFPFGLQAQSSPRREAELGQGGGHRLAWVQGRCGENREKGVRDSRGCPIWGAGFAPALHPALGLPLASWDGSEGPRIPVLSLEGFRGSHSTWYLSAR